MRQWITFGIVASMSLGLAGFAAAAEKGEKKKGERGDPAARFKQLDTNSDGKISADEWKAGSKSEKAAEFFARLDKNKDGFIDADEFKAMGERKGKGKDKK